MLTGFLKPATLCIAVVFVAGCGGQHGPHETADNSNPFALDAEAPAGVRANRSRTATRETSGRRRRGNTSEHSKQRTAGTVRSSRSPSRSETAAAKSEDHSSPEGVIAVDAGVPESTNSAQQATIAAHPLVGQQAGDFELSRLDGTRFRLQDHQSKEIVVVDFWTTWCKPCVEMIPALERIAADYRNIGVAFCSINVEQESPEVRDFLARRRLQVRVALDSDGKVADKFDVESFPTLVLIDKTGVIRSVHVGEIRDLNAILRGELDALLDGRELTGAVFSGQAEDVGNLEPEIDGDWAGSARQPHHMTNQPAEYLLHLESGREIDVGEIFRQEGREYQQRLATLMRGRRQIRINYDDGTPSVLAGRLGGRLHGPTVAFYDTGKTMAYLNYSRGQRDGTVFTWDSESRPVVFEQYEDGKREGIRCLFKACCQECTDGHIWLVEEWSHDELVETHLVPDDGEPVTLGAAGSEGLNGRATEGSAASPEDPQSTSTADSSREVLASIEDELQDALNELADFERTLERGERDLQQSLLNINRYQARRQRAARAQARAKAARRGGFAMRSQGLRIRSCLT